MSRDRVLAMIKGHQLTAKWSGDKWWIDRASLDDVLRRLRWAGTRGAA